MSKLNEKKSKDFLSDISIEEFHITISEPLYTEQTVFIKMLLILSEHNTFKSYAGDLLVETRSKFISRDLYLFCYSRVGFELSDVKPVVKEFLQLVLKLLIGELNVFKLIFGQNYFLENLMLYVNDITKKIDKDFINQYKMLENACSDSSAIFSCVLETISISFELSSTLASFEKKQNDNFYLRQLLLKRVVPGLLKVFYQVLDSESETFLKLLNDINNNGFEEVSISDDVLKRTYVLTAVIEEYTTLYEKLNGMDCIQYMEEINIDLLLSKFISPILKYIEQLARRNTQNEKDALLVSSLFRINNLVFLQQALKGYSACALFVESFTNEIEKYSDHLSVTLVNMFFQKLGPPSEADWNKWNQYIRDFSLNQIDKLENHRVKQSIKNSTVSILIKKYAEVYDNVINDKDKNLENSQIILYSPDDVKKLLENI